MEEYLLYLLAFGTTFVAIIGNTWDEKKEGIFKFTCIGYIAIILAMGTAIFSSVLTYKTREPKLVYSKFVDIYKGGYWTAPNKLLPGAKVRFDKFDCELEFYYGAHSVTIPKTDRLPFEFTVMSMAGEFEGPGRYKWQIYNGKSRRCTGQIFVLAKDDLEKSD